MNSKIKSLLKAVYYLPSNTVNKTKYAVHGVKCGKHHETKGSICIKSASSSKITLGNDVRINSKGSANPIGAGERTYFQVGKNAEFSIGNGTRISNCAITCMNKVTIGDNVRIGAGVKVYDTDFHSIDPLERTAVPEIPSAKTAPIVIEDYAFIGAGSFILKGVTVGNASVVAAGAVVTKDIPPFEIWGGNPAKKIGEVKTELK